MSKIDMATAHARNSGNTVLCHSSRHCRLTYIKLHMGLTSINYDAELTHAYKNTNHNLTCHVSPGLQLEYRKFASDFFWTLILLLTKLV